MISVLRRIEFDAGHRLVNHESKCATLHGHRYALEIEVSAEQLDELGRVIDFQVIKDRLAAWIDENWDHNVILFEEDRETITALRSIPRKKDPYICDFNPTAENLANYLLCEIAPRLFKDFPVQILSVSLWETPNCRAIARK